MATYGSTERSTVSRIAQGVNGCYAAAEGGLSAGDQTTGQATVWGSGPHPLSSMPFCTVLGRDVFEVLKESEWIA